jgi:hypothetical protein
MRRVPAFAFAVAATAAIASAQSQFAARQVSVKVPSLTTATTTGGFLGGTDDCLSAHVALPAGDVFGEPFTTGTTGTQGQNEALCLAFGTSGVGLDVWFDWIATATGNASVSTCGGTGVDTKIAVYPFTGASACPANGTSLACNDDSCGLQSTTTWGANSGTQYTIQLGTFPGAVGGSGTFNITQTAPPPCGAYDDGSTENSLGLIAGGEIVWIQGGWNCAATVTGIQTAYGSLMFPGSVTNGANSKLGCYNDTDTTPGNGETLHEQINTTVTNGDTDILNANPLTTSMTVTGFAQAAATADQVAGQFPGPMDQTQPTPNAWVAGSTAGPGTADLNNLAGGIGIYNMAAIGFPSSWLLRIDGGGPPPGPGTSDCEGDGTGTTACPCGNTGGAGEGCANSTGSGATLTGTGTASFSGDTVVLTAANALPAQPGLFFQGDMSLNGGNGLAFGDGLRCAGTDVVRLVTIVPDGSGCAASDASCGTPAGGTPGSISANPGQAAAASVLGPGDTGHYQFWYRDPIGSPCGGLFNLTNLYSILWSA